MTTRKAYLYILYIDNLYIKICPRASIQRGAWLQICSRIMNPIRWLMLPGAYELDALYLCTTLYVGCAKQEIMLILQKTSGSTDKKEYIHWFLTSQILYLMCCHNWFNLRIVSKVQRHWEEETILIIFCTSSLPPSKGNQVQKSMNLPADFPPRLQRISFCFC